eukprot:PhM_4_TR16746/c0_g1_i1/m.56068
MQLFHGRRARVLVRHGVRRMCKRVRRRYVQGHQHSDLHRGDAVATERGHEEHRRTEHVRCRRGQRSCVHRVASRACDAPEHRRVRRAHLGPGPGRYGAIRLRAQVGHHAHPERRRHSNIKRVVIIDVVRRVDQPRPPHRQHYTPGRGAGKHAPTLHHTPPPPAAAASDCDTIPHHEQQQQWHQHERDGRAGRVQPDAELLRRRVDDVDALQCSGADDAGLVRPRPRDIRRRLIVNIVVVQRGVEFASRCCNRVGAVPRRRVRPAVPCVRRRGCFGRHVAHEDVPRERRDGHARERDDRVADARELRRLPDGRRATVRANGCVRACPRHHAGRVQHPP